MPLVQGELDEEAVVRVTLINNPGLAAEYASLGIAVPHGRAPRVSPIPRRKHPNDSDLATTMLSISRLCRISWTWCCCRTAGRRPSDLWMRPKPA